MPPTRSQPARRTLDVAAVYRDHFAYVFTNLRRLGVPAAALEDACHDVFVVVHRRARSYDPGCALRTWLYGVVRRVAADIRRNGGRHRRRLDALREVEPRVRAHDDTIADRRLVQDFLDALDDDKREVFILVELEEMTAREVADVLAINPNTAAARLRAARRVFAERLSAIAIAETELLRAARVHEAPERARARVWSGLAPLLVDVASAPAITSAGWVAALVVAGSTLGIATVMARPVDDEVARMVAPTRAETPPPAADRAAVRDETPVLATSVVPPVAIAPVPVVAPRPLAAPARAPTEPKAIPRPRTEPAAAAPDDPLRAETELAGRVLRATDPDEILALVTDYRRRFADGFFADRLTARRIEALCRTNRRALATQEHDALSQRQPALARRALATCDATNDHESRPTQPSSG